jgi:hypothetical protein
MYGDEVTGVRSQFTECIRHASAVRYAQKEAPVYTPSAVTAQQEIQAAVDSVAADLKTDVRKIRWNIGQDWCGDWAIFFRVLLSDFSDPAILDPVGEAEGGSASEWQIIASRNLLSARAASFACHRRSEESAGRADKSVSVGSYRLLQFSR